jgi:hypothetical protein
MLLQMIPDITTFLLSYCRPFRAGARSFQGRSGGNFNTSLLIITCSLITPDPTGRVYSVLDLCTNTDTTCTPLMTAFPTSVWGYLHKSPLASWRGEWELGWQHGQIILGFWTKEAMVTGAPMNAESLTGLAGSYEAVACPIVPAMRIVRSYDRAFLCEITSDDCKIEQVQILSLRSSSDLI